MAVRLTCTDSAQGHDGLRWRMGPTSESVDIVVGETAPGVGELIVNEPIIPEACFSVAAYAGSEESVSAVACETTDPSFTDWGDVEIGDYVEGGIYAGIDTINDIDYRIIAGLEESEAFGLQWKTTQTETPDMAVFDGLANTLAMAAAGLEDHPAAAHCLAYTGGGHNDWHMPGRTQLQLLSNLASHPEFAANVSSGSLTWSSTQVSEAQAHNRSLSENRDYNGNKTMSNRFTRPIRRVPV